MASLQGIFTVCFCPTYDSLGGTATCDADVEFIHAAGQLTVAGPVGNEDQQCTAGIACTLGPFAGIALASSDRVAFVRNTGIEQCGVDARDAVNIAGGYDVAVVPSSSTAATVQLTASELP
jgi:hypothetical protein